MFQGVQALWLNPDTVTSSAYQPGSCMFNRCYSRGTCGWHLVT